VDDERIWTELRDLRNEIREMRQAFSPISERLRVVEIARENSMVRQTAMPGWIIMSLSLIVSLTATIGSLWAAGRVP